MYIMPKKKSKPETNDFRGNQLILIFETPERKGIMHFRIKPEAIRLSKKEAEILLKYECQMHGIKNAKLIEIIHGDIIQSIRKRYSGFGGNIEYFITKDVPPSAFGIKRKKRINRK